LTEDKRIRPKARARSGEHKLLAWLFRQPASAPQKQMSQRVTFCLYEAGDRAKVFSMTKFDLRGEDCIEGMSRLKNKSVDLVVTSPPYNLGIVYGQYTDRQDRQSYLDWCLKWAGQIRTVLCSNGSFFLNIGSAPSNPMLPYQIAIELTSASGGFVLQNTIHWIKSIALEHRCSRRPGDDGTGRHQLRQDNASERKTATAVRSYGHFKPINSKRFLNDCHEYVFHFTKSGRVEIDRLALGVPYQDKSNIARWSHTHGSDVRCRGNTWFIPYETIQSRSKERPHPATFPVQLAEWCIRLHGVSRVKSMLDPFLGIGNSAVAARRCGVKRFIGFEIDETYLAEAKRRLDSTSSRSTASVH
jgi:site-specific DNA-methyltransferase (adenine-specific)